MHWVVRASHAPQRESHQSRRRLDGAFVAQHCLALRSEMEVRVAVVGRV